MEKGADRLRNIIVENMANSSAMYQAARPGTCPLTFRGKNGGRGEREMMRDGIFKVLTSRYLENQGDLLRKIIVENMANPSAMYQAARPGTCPLTSRGNNGGRGEREMMREGIFKVLTSKYLVDEADLLRKIVVEHIANPSGMSQAARPGACSLTAKQQLSGWFSDKYLEFDLLYNRCMVMQIIWFYFV